MSSAAAQLELPESSAPERLVLQVKDIRCAACALKIERQLNQLVGITRCRTNVPAKQVVVDFDPIQLNEEKVLDAISALGFTPGVLSVDENLNPLGLEGRQMLTRLGISGIGMMQVMMFSIATYVAVDMEPAYISLMHWAAFAISTPIALYSAAPFHLGAWQSLKHRNLGMDVPVSLAILSAYFLSSYHVLSGQGGVYFDSVCMFTFLLLVGRYLELVSRRRYTQSLSLAESCLPESAVLVSTEQAVPIDALLVGDCVRVAPGEILPADGVVKEGTGSVSEAAFTGESTPVNKAPGSRVLAGAINHDQMLVIEVKVPPSEFVIRKVSNLHQEAMLYKPAFSILADKVASYFIGFILLTACLSGLGWYLLGAEDWFVILITVLVVSCPCALSLATPVVYTVAVTALKQKGVVVRTGKLLEQLAQVDRIVFDKTGTLTRGQLQIEAVQLLGDKSESEVLAICGALEQSSHHPIANALPDTGAVQASDVQVHAGQGVEGIVAGQRYRFGKASFCQQALERPVGEGIWVLLSSDKPLAWIKFSDAIKADAMSLVAALKHAYRVSLLTGDAKAEAQRIASALDIEDWQAEASPEDKLKQIRVYQAAGEKVLMVGDGVNDAAAMGAANTAIAVSPVDIVVQDAADATLLSQDVAMLQVLLSYAQRVRAIIKQNMVWAVLYNVSVIPLAVLGVLQPWMAALGMSFSSLLVILNANRLLYVETNIEEQN